ncbi:MAG: SCO1664 family protein [Acidimicrobiales bacterium]
MPPPERAPDSRVLKSLELLRQGQVELEGRLPWSSNGTFLVRICHQDREGLAVYKPERGERPLWDFPGGLFRREVAAWVVSEALGWGLVPPTIVRDGPFGPGSLQEFVEAHFEEHYFTLLDQPGHHEALRRIATFDLLINNADRKGGHCLLGHDRRVWAIDHGLSFHDEPKLRTVIWDFAGEQVPAPLVADLARLAVRGTPPELADLLDAVERDALLARAAAVVSDPRFPEPSSGRSYPWPMV